MDSLTYDELKVLNFGKPTKELIDKAIRWAESEVWFYANETKFMTDASQKLEQAKQNLASFEKHKNELYPE